MASVTVEVKDVDEVRTIINRLNTIKGVVEVLRAGHQTGLHKLREVVKEEEE